MEEPAVVFTKGFRQNNGLQKHAKQAPYRSKASGSTQSKHPTNKKDKTKTDPEGIPRRFNAGGEQIPNSGGRETKRESEKRVPTRGPKQLRTRVENKKEIDLKEDFGESNSSVRG